MVSVKFVYFKWVVIVFLVDCIEFYYMGWEGGCLGRVYK